MQTAGVESPYRTPGQAWHVVAQIEERHAAIDDEPLSDMLTKQPVPATSKPKR
jgi:hypothetical protein